MSNLEIIKNICKDITEKVDSVIDADEHARINDCVQISKDMLADSYKLVNQVNICLRLFSGTNYKQDGFIFFGDERN